MSEWITDRRPTIADCNDTYIAAVYDSKGRLQPYEAIADGEPWKPIPKCEPYVKMMRAMVVVEQCYDNDGFEYAVRLGIGTVARHIPTREAAERIAAIYEEAMP